MMQQVAEAQYFPEVPIDENFQTLEHQAVYGKRHAVTSGLTWGYYGGRWGGFAVTAGTFTLTGSATNYIVVEKATGTPTCLSASTNWDNLTDYSRVYKIATTASAVDGEPEDHRAGPGGIHYGQGGGSGSGGTELRGLTFVSDTASQTDSDPGAGKLRWNNATQASATVLYIDNSTADTVSLTTFWASLGSSGFLYIQQGDDSARWQFWKWTATPVDGTGYRKFTVTLQASLGSIEDGKTLYCDFSGSGGGSLTNFAESVNSSSPNTTVPVVRLLATNAATNVDAALSPKGSGAITAHVPDSTSAGGNKRGTRAVDLQLERNAAGQVASGTASVLVGGTKNTASGVDAAVIGGESNTSSGTYSAVVGSNLSTATQTGSGVFAGSAGDATANYAVVLGGTSSDATAESAAVLGGQTNVASGQQAVVLGGTSNTADGQRSVASGWLANARGANAARVHASGSPNVTGNAQYRRMHLYCSQTSDATQTTLTAGAGAASTTNQLNLPNNSAFFVTGTIVGRSSTGNASSWEFKCLIKRGASAGTTALVGPATVSMVSQDASASAWAVSVTADTTNGTLSLKVTGEAATIIRWSAVVKSNEVVF